jgi:hypothetical protein
MIEIEGADLLLATIPTQPTAQQLREEFNLSPLTHDIYAAYTGACGARFAGYLVAARGNIDRMVALCPVSSDLETASAMWRREISRQRAIASRIAGGPVSRALAEDAVWLGWIGCEPREIPTWLFSLACVPLTYEWDGKLLFPRPFCPRMFESMASQPQAPEWVMNWLSDRRLNSGSISIASGDLNE